ncbi:ChrA protein [Planococcus glaciei]|uniref:chromate efflux transporter n=1 Tax=Planococcus glaciei TaxID=459472 RepID=UPI0003DF1983|nr:chromate efflux transporter [Planococcus glaciei]ETP68326.1 ChrA protein [Planococcus glaciei CHR43]KOF10130.1 ChrA protein [Planococcus glaciei]MBX0316156.1 chromate efflux transporter [Planococcus glaciei]
MAKKNYMEILKASTKLGLTSFGGPTAHLGYFREEYVVKRKWLDDKAYADLVALCQFLPGPASSQVGISIGMLRGGIFGGFLSWFGFTMPSVILLVLFALLVTNGSFDSGWIQGLKIVAVAVVAHALMGMGKSLAPDKPRIAIAVGAAAAILLMPTAWAQIGIIVLTGIIGYFLYRKAEAPEAVKLALTFGKKTGLAAWAIFAGLLIGLPLLRPVIESSYYAIFDIFYRVGSIVFGGGHVVLPMLEREVVPNWMSADLFISGYGAAQAVPGPLFTLAGYLGQLMGSGLGVLLAVVAMFLPSFLLVIGTLPFWSIIRTKSGVQAALKGVNAGVVGILLAALYDPVFTSGIRGPLDFAIAIIAFAMLVYFKLAPWIVVLVTAILGAGAYAFLS